MLRFIPVCSNMDMHAERSCWESSDMAEPSSPTALTYPHVPKSTTDSECARPAHTPALSPAELATPWPRSPSQDAPMHYPPMDGPSSTELYHVDLDNWYPAYEACMRFFLDEGQHTGAVQSLAAFLNIRLPCQRATDAITCFSPAATGVSLRAYIRRLVVTAHDTPAVLRAFFGSEWTAGVATAWQQERINYLFTAKSGGWAATKAAYDERPDEQTPFLRPLRAPTEDELRMAESRWSEWLAMEDWMVGPRSPW